MKHRKMSLSTLSSWISKWGRAVRISCISAPAQLVLCIMCPCTENSANPLWRLTWRWPWVFWIGRGQSLCGKPVDSQMVMEDCFPSISSFSADPEYPEKDKLVRLLTCAFRNRTSVQCLKIIGWIFIQAMSSYYTCDNEEIALCKRSRDISKIID